MGRKSDDPVNHVISFRVNDLEKSELEKIASSFGVSISTLMRECINELENITPPRLFSRRDT
jgi:AraC-like DNA-binding protein